MFEHVHVQEQLKYNVHAIFKEIKCWQRRFLLHVTTCSIIHVHVGLVGL